MNLLRIVIAIIVGASFASAQEALSASQTAAEAAASQTPLLASVLAFSQNSSSPPAQTAPGIVQRMLVASGWAPTLPGDVIARSTVAMGGDPTAMKTITFKARGVTQFRWEYSDAPGKASIADFGSNLAAGPKGIGLRPQASQPWQFPFLGPLLQLSDPSVVVKDLGIENLGEPAYKLQIHRVPRPGQARADEVIAGSPITVWVSTITYLPIQIEYLKQTLTDRLAFEHRLRKYRDYRVVQGFQVAFHQEERSFGQLLHTLVIDSVAFNVGLPASDFHLSSQIGGRQ